MKTWSNYIENNFLQTLITHIPFLEKKKKVIQKQINPEK